MFRPLSTPGVKLTLLGDSLSVPWSPLPHSHLMFRPLSTPGVKLALLGSYHCHTHHLMFRPLGTLGVRLTLLGSYHCHTRHLMFRPLSTPGVKLTLLGSSLSVPELPPTLQFSSKSAGTEALTFRRNTQGRLECFFSGLWVFLSCFYYCLVCIKTYLFECRFDLSGS